MPLLYYARQSQLKTKDGVKQWHLTLKKVGRAVSLQQLGEMVAEKCSATPGDVHNVIRELDVGDADVAASMPFFSHLN